MVRVQNLFSVPFSGSWYSVGDIDLKLSEYPQAVEQYDPRALKGYACSQACVYEQRL
jgi:hypothetical protein